MKDDNVLYEEQHITAALQEIMNEEGGGHLSIFVAREPILTARVDSLSNTLFDFALAKSLHTVPVPVSATVKATIKSAILIGVLLVEAINKQREIDYLSRSLDYEKETEQDSG